MKYSHLALAAMVSSFGLQACSDDPKPSQGGLEQSSASIGGGDTPIVGASSSSAAVIVEDPNEKIPTVPNSTVATTNVSVTGMASAGPMYTGATVSMTGIDPSSLATIGTAISAKTTNDKGEFALTGAIGSSYAKVEVTGYYYNYILDEKHGPITLEALTNTADRSVVNVNMLTHIEAARVRTLIAGGMTFSDAKLKAEKEIRVTLGLSADSTLFEDISLTTEGKAGANLLAITSIIMGERNAENASTILNAITEDIALDGTFDNSGMAGVLADEAFVLSVGAAAGGLRSQIDDNVVYFSGPVNSFWGVQYGLGFCTTDGIVLPNTNASSANVGKKYLCSKGSWGEATADILNAIAMAGIFGECNATLAGTIKSNEGSYYVCKNNLWLPASSDEIGNTLVAATAGACDDSKYGKVETYDSKYYVCVPPSWKAAAHTPVDYSKGNAMNKKLGKGINFGNSWDSQGSNDCGWSNCIDDNDFSVAKAAGFNSVRIPVRWHHDASNTAVSSSRLAGVKDDITKAIAAGLVVIVNFHHYTDLMDAAEEGATAFNNEKQKFLNLWKQVAKEMDQFPDDKLVLEVLNEPTIVKAAYVDQLSNEAYKVIRAQAPGKTIMFESYHAGKFYDLDILNLPEDGNIIYSGHYYEPFNFSHQGHGYDCKGDAAYANTASKDMKEYKDQATMLYPDINGGHIPLNMGEFGIAGKCNVTDGARTKWTKATVQAAEANDMSWHYWCFKNCGGFEAYSGSWKSGFLDAFGLK